MSYHQAQRLPYATSPHWNAEELTWCIKCCAVGYSPVVGKVKVAGWASANCCRDLPLQLTINFSWISWSTNTWFSYLGSKMLPKHFCLHHQMIDWFGASVEAQCFMIESSDSTQKLIWLTQEHSPKHCVPVQALIFPGSGSSLLSTMGFAAICDCDTWANN